MSRCLRLAVMASGMGSNFQALVRHTRGVSIDLLISDRPGAPVMRKARRCGVKAVGLPGLPVRTRHEHGIMTTLRRHRIQAVALAGYMRLLSPAMVRSWRILNIHPSLLPDYPGLDTHRRVLADGRRWHGCTIHEVDAGMDTGRPLARARVRIRSDDSPRTLARRVLRHEHQLYPLTLARWARRRMRLPPARPLPRH